MNSEKELDRYYELGCWAFADGLKKRFADRAGEAFAAGLDERAKILRDLSEEFEEEAKSMRKHLEGFCFRAS